MALDTPTPEAPGQELCVTQGPPWPTLQSSSQEVQRKTTRFGASTSSS